jgi:hypothetical protein
LIASSKLSSDVALNSVTRATGINTPFFVFPYLKSFYPCIGSVNAKALVGRLPYHEARALIRTLALSLASIHQAAEKARKRHLDEQGKST